MRKVIVVLILVVQILQFVIGAELLMVTEAGASSQKTEDTLKRLTVIEFKNGTKGSGVVVKETPEAIFLADSDGNGEASFPRDSIAAVRRPNAEELESLRQALDDEAIANGVSTVKAEL